ncbi:MAG: type II and III secretion system protein family protein [Xanthobacteraceae bacterium]
MSSFKSLTKRGCGRTATGAVLFMAMALLAIGAVPIFSAAHAQAPEFVQHVVIPLNKSVTIPTQKAISSVQVDSPTIVSARAITDQRLYIQARGIGTTSVSIYDQNLQLMKIIEIEVALDTSVLESKIRAATGNVGIHVGNDNGQIVLSGVASDAVAAQRAADLATAFGASCGKIVPGGSAVASGPGTAPAAGSVPVSGPGASANGVSASGPGSQVALGLQCTVVNLMTIASPQQVMLKVRFLEVDRNAGRQLGVNINGSNPGGTNGISTGAGGLSCAPPCSTSSGGGIFQAAGTLVGTGVGAPFGTVLAEVVNKGVNINTLVTALETKGLLQRLAEPNLVAISGETASFIAGGQYPVPTPAAVGVPAGFTYEPYGVQLKFRPTVLNNGIINISINPTVSELDFTNAVTISGTTIPSLTERSATTTVELRDGQSFAIAGLLQADNQRNISQLPWIGSVPVLGTLFRSSSYQKDQTDLVIIVTPSLAQPAAPGARLATPLDSTIPSNDVDFFLMGQMEQRKKYTDYVTTGGDLQGPYGYMLGVMQDPPSPQK